MNLICELNGPQIVSDKLKHCLSEVGPPWRHENTPSELRWLLSPSHDEMFFKFDLNLVCSPYIVNKKQNWEKYGRNYRAGKW